VLTLYLLRHAKSSWQDAATPDHDRGLSARGERNAPAIGAHMAANDLIPERIVCSTAVRAKRTLELVLPELLGDVSGKTAIATTSTGAIYEAWGKALLGIIRSQDKPSHVSRVMIVGHNPSMQSVALRLIGQSRNEASRRLEGKYPTCGLAEIRFETELWSEIEEGAGRLIRFDTPKRLATSGR